MAESIDRAAISDGDRPNLTCWHEWEIDGRLRRIILCVETSLELRPGFEGFDPQQLDALIRDATDKMRASAAPIDGIKIVPAR